MSANNYILISKKSFKIWHRDAETEDGEQIGQGKSLENAVEIAENWCQQEENASPFFQLEYGFWFCDK